MTSDKYDIFISIKKNIKFNDKLINVFPFVPYQNWKLYFPNVIHHDILYSNKNLKLENKWLNYFLKSYEDKVVTFNHKYHSARTFSKLDYLKINSPTDLYLINFIRDKFAKIKHNKIETKLTLPYYNFTRTNLEGLMPSSFFHWNTSEFSFRKSNIYFLDLIYTKKLLNTFFSVKNVHTTHYWNRKRLSESLLVLPRKMIAKKFKLFIKLTALRTSSWFKEFSIIPNSIYKSGWLKKEFKYFFDVKDALSTKENKVDSYLVNRYFFWSLYRRPLLSIPRFKHTNSSLIIDLFLFNNKNYKIKKFIHIISRRSMYKYMYSMYANYSEKIQETLNRPRFFYLNLIQPNIAFHYGKILKLYQETLLKTSTVNLFLFRNKTKLTPDNSTYFDNYKGNIYYSDKATKKIQKPQIFSTPLKNTYFKYSIKTLKIYLKALEEKYNTTFDEILSNITEDNTKKRKIKRFGRDKFSLRSFKKRNLFDSKSKRPIDPKKAKEKLMSFFNYSNFQKKSIMPRTKFYFDKKKYHHISIPTWKSVKKTKDIREILKVRVKKVSSKEKWDLNKYSTSGYWYSIYYLSYLRREYNQLRKDIIVSKEINYYPKSSFSFNEKPEILEYNNNKGKINIYLHPSPSFKEGIFNDKIFKPYYRYMIHFFIYKRFRNMLNNSLLYDLVIVRTVFDLMRYNYRSMLKVNSELYFIDKLRYYKSEFNVKTILAFITSMKFIKRKEKTPENFWQTYDEEAGNYFNRIRQYSELNQKRQVLLPFTFYFEDILYSIYGKWGLVRLWPLKKKMLSSTILAQVLSEVTNVDIDGYNTRYIENYQKALLVIKKYIDYAGKDTKKWYSQKLITPWPKELLNQEGISQFKSLNKYDRKLGIMENLVTYRNITILKEWKYKKFHLQDKEFSSLSLRRYINYIKDNTDLMGYRSTIRGKTAKPGKLARSIYKMYEYGHLSMPLHWDKNFKLQSHSLRRHRATLYSHRNFNKHSYINRNGMLTLRLWLYSKLTVDVRDILYYLLSIRGLYNSILNKTYHGNITQLVE
jgi:hypothetical protein